MTSIRQALRRYRTYGGWSVQRPGFGTLGRYSPDMIRPLPGGRFELRFRLDRAAYQLFRDLGVSHEEALHHSLLCPGWASLHDAPGRGVWEIEIDPPDTDRIEMVALLWPQDDAVWPMGEINLMEGRLAQGETMTNLHWPDPTSGAPEHDPLMVPLDTTQRHRYRVDVQPGRVRWWVDGRLVRDLRTPHAPYDVPVHMVVQGGVHASILDDWHPDMEWEQRIIIRPLRAPHNHRKENHA